MLSPLTALRIRIDDDPVAAGRAAAAEAAEALRYAQAEKGSARVVLAAAPASGTSWTL